MYARMLLIALGCAGAAGFLGAAGDDRTSDTMASAANNFLLSLDADQRDAAALGFHDPRRFDWHFIPKERKGLSMLDMSPDQHHLLHALLGASLSRAGHGKTATVMSLEAVLRELEEAAGANRFTSMRDPLRYHVTFFGDPGGPGDWGWSFEGHHVSLNFTVVAGEATASTPLFLGANPHRVPSGPREGLRALGREEDLARALLESLDEEQRRKAVIADEAPRDIFSSNQPRVERQAPGGLPASALCSDQRELLDALIDEYAANVPPDLAARRRAQVEAAGNAIHFAWMGPGEPGAPHYYRVQAPDFVIEYDNVQNDANHSHTVWRDFDGDFGRDLLAEHHRDHEHRAGRRQDPP